MQDDRLYDPSFVQQLFDEMAGTYGLVNMASSFGFARRWRRQCVRQIEIPKASTVVDLMTGMGELCPNIAPFVGTRGQVVAIDISQGQVSVNRRYLQDAEHFPVNVLPLSSDGCG